MNTRMVISILTIAVASALTPSYAGQKTAATPTDTSASAPGMRYEAHVNAGGVAPPSIPLPRRPASRASDAKNGESLFYSMNCDGCHGAGASGDVGPSLVDGRWRYGGADEEVFQSIFYGRPKGMPAFGGVIGSDGVWMIVGYLKSQPVPDIVPTINYDELENPAPTSATPAASAASEPKHATDPMGQMTQDGCVACHAIDRKIVGPAFRDVAAKYHGMPDVAQRLEAKVKNGGAGVWGDVPMPPNSAASDADIHNIVTWILTSPEVRK